MSQDEYLDGLVRGVGLESDISLDSDLYKEIVSELVDFGLNLAFFVLKTATNSCCARILDGDSRTCPVLTLYLKYDADFRSTGIDPHRGNWADKWALTGAVRDLVNTSLLRHGLDDDFVSDHTFVFVRTLEQLAFREIGRCSKDSVLKFVSKQCGDVSRVFWDGRRFYVVMEKKSDYKRAKRKLKHTAAGAVSKILSAADSGGYCQVYKAEIEFGYSGMNLLHLIREDL